MNSIKEALGEALKRRKLGAMDKEPDDPWSMNDSSDEENKESPEEKELEQKAADMAPDVKDKGKMDRKPAIQIDIKTDDGGLKDKMLHGHNAADELSDDGKQDDLSTLMGKSSSPEEIAQLAGGGRPKSLYEAAAKMLAAKKMKV